MKPRALLVLAVLTLSSCGLAGHPAARGPARPGAASGQLSPAQAAQVFTRFLTAFERAETAHTRAASTIVMTGPELEDQTLLPGFTGPAFTSLSGQRVYLPRLHGYPRWFIDPPPGGTVTDYFNGKSITWAKRG